MIVRTCVSSAMLQLLDADCPSLYVRPYSEVPGKIDKCDNPGRYTNGRNGIHGAVALRSAGGGGKLMCLGRREATGVFDSYLS
jgi:hypothetical protein